MFTEEEENICARPKVLSRDFAQSTQIVLRGNLWSRIKKDEASLRAYFASWKVWEQMATYIRWLRNSSAGNKYLYVGNDKKKLPKKKTK